MGDLMSITDMLARLRADAASELFEGAKLGPIAVRELLRHVDSLAARLAAIEAQEPVAWVPIHPRTGPLWSMTTGRPAEERLPQHYPLKPLYTRPAPATELRRERAGVDVGTGTGREAECELQRAAADDLVGGRCRASGTDGHRGGHRSQHQAAAGAIFGL